jgi:hypothetical protein
VQNEIVRLRTAVTVEDKAVGIGLHPVNIAIIVVIEFHHASPPDWKRLSPKVDHLTIAAACHQTEGFP